MPTWGISAASRSSIAWFGLVLPALVLNYFGQGALLLADPAAIENPFYLLAPELGAAIRWWSWPPSATVIASQAVISGAFSITQQAIQLGYSAAHGSAAHVGTGRSDRSTCPAINWLLLVAVVALVLGFGSSTNLAAAYGIAVTGTMVITNVLAFVVARRHVGRGARGAPCLAPCLSCCIDLAFFAANSVKIVDGGWFPLVFGLASSCC